MEFLLAAITLGFLGSFHCIGMCGPIALALPVNGKSRSNKVVSILAYNAGRIFTYSLFGLLFGLLGQSVALFGYQQKLSILIGVLILAGLILPGTVLNRWKISAKFYSLFSGLKTRMALQFQQRGIRSLFSIGLLNGLLPCGLLYIAIAGAISTGNVFKSSLFMAAFGAGTLPFMFSLTYTSQFFNVSLRNKIRKAVPVMVGFMALLLIVRGLNLGLPYISPKMELEKKGVEAAPHQQIHCCHKK